MIKIAANGIFDYSRLTAGTGQITDNANTITLTSATNTDKAYIHQYFAVRAGTRITVRATARCLTLPDTGKEMKLGIDNYKQGLVNQMSINSTDWRTYTVSTIVPYDKTGITQMKAVIGAWNNQISSIEVAEFEVLAENAGFSSARIHAMGVINLNTGEPDAHRVSIGIRDVMYQNGVLTIKTDDLSGLGLDSILPVQTLQLQASVKCPIQAYISDFARANGVVKVKFTDMKTGGKCGYSSKYLYGWGQYFQIALYFFVLILK